MRARATFQRRRARPIPPGKVYPFRTAWDRARYPEHYLRFGYSEEAVAIQCIDRLRARWRAEVTRIDSGDRRLRGRAAAMLAAAGADPRQLNGRGTTMDRGISDLHVTFPHLGGRTGWFELKVPEHLVVSPKTGKLIQEAEPGEPTLDQAEYLLRQHRAGAIVGFIWWSHELDELIEGTGRIQKEPDPDLAVSFTG